MTPWLMSRDPPGCRYKNIVGENHRSYAATLNNLGLVYLAQAQQAEGKRVQQLGFLDRCGGRGYHVAMWAVRVSDDGDHCLGGSAEQALREVLRIRGQLFEADDPSVVTTRANLASVLQRTGRVAEVSW
jgi:hypothetical protein